MSSGTYYVTVLGNGSYALPPGPIWRGPAVYEITAEQAEAILMEKEAGRVGDYVLVSTTKPDFEPPEPPTGVFTMDDLRFERPDEEPDRVSPDDDYEPAPDEFPCGCCPASFTSDAGLRQHTALKHSRVHERIEDEAREQLAAEKAARAARERVSQASSGDPKSVRPEERTVEDEVPSGPSLWPPDSITGRCEPATRPAIRPA